MKKRSYSTQIKAKTGNTTTVIASTPTPDRYDDVVSGGDEWLIDKYMKNPVVQFGHDYSIPPVGKTEKLTTDADGNLIATIRWDDSPTNPLGQTVAAQFRDGFMSAVSVGFQPGRSTPRNKLPTDHPHYGEKGMQFTQNQLLEISAVPVPANGEALALRGIGTEQIKSILSVEETEDSYIVTYAKYGGGADEELEEEAYGDEPDEEEEAIGDESEDEDMPDDEEDGDEEEEAAEEDDEEKTFRSVPSAQTRSIMKGMVRDAIIDLIAEDEIMRSLLYPSLASPTTTKRGDAVSALFGIDK